LAGLTNPHFVDILAFMSDTEKIIESIGRRRLRQALGVGETAISNVLSRGRRFPASWYGPLKELCDREGVECPISAFNWKSAGKVA